jgi:antitoxin ParD1/3/4
MLKDRRLESMPASKAIRVDLGAQRTSLQRHLESGQYEDASDVVRDALRALDRQHAVLDELLREEVRTSMADKRPSAPIDEVFRRVRARIARRAKATRRGA